MNPHARYLRVRPQGIVQWMSRAPDARQADQRLFRTLLRQPHNATPVSLGHLSERSGLSRGQVAQSLFGLHRLGSIQVAIDAPPPLDAPRHPTTDIHRQLQRLCDDAASAAVLADPDGLCMASHGVAPDDAQRLAAGLPLLRRPMVRIMPLYISHRPCRLHITASALLENDALVGLAHSLYELLSDGG